MPELNTVVLTGNLTRDPELRHTGGGTPVCNMRVASNTRRKEGNDWVDKPNYFDVTVWGKQGENAAEYLAKGRKVGLQGRLEWREWEAKDGTKRQAVEIVAHDVIFLGGKPNEAGGSGASGQTSDVPADTADLPPATGGGEVTGSDDDIPF